MSDAWVNEYGVPLAIDGNGKWITVGGRPDSKTGEKHVGGQAIKTSKLNDKPKKIIGNVKKHKKGVPSPTSKPSEVSPTLKPDEVRSHYDNYLNSIPKDVISSIDQYCGQSSVYQEINGLLRGNMSEDDFDESPDALSDINKAIKDMDSMINKSPPLKRESISYRGVTGDFVKKLKPGAVIKDKGFVSTTYDKGSAEQAMSDADEDDLTAMIHITMPKGTRALWGSGALEKLYPDKFGDTVMDESELVLGRGSKFRVVSRTKVSGKLYKIEAELLP